MAAVHADPEVVGDRAPMTRDARYRRIRRVTLVGTGIDLGLGIGKVAAGWFAQSQALIADGLHSLSDLASDVLVLFAARQANAEADADHPYGHERIETAATVGLGLALIAVGFGVGYEAVGRLLDPTTLWRPHAWALWVAGLSVVSKEALYQYTVRAARRTRSKLLEANAWHHRSDAASSVVVIVGVGATLVGLHDLDAIAALVVAWMIARIGFGLVRKSMRELIDTGLDPEQLAAIRATILSVAGVRALHLLRTRQMGGKALVDVHIILDDPRMSVSEGHQISETVRGRLIGRIDNVDDVTVHIDPEDDELVAPGRNLGLRSEVEARLRERWAALPGADAIRRIDLHYLGGRIYVDVEMPLDTAGDAAQAAALRARYQAAVAGDKDIAEVRLLYTDAPK